MIPINHTPARDQRRIRLSGPLNASQAATVTEEFRRLVAQDVREVVIDLTDVPFVDSRGLLALANGFRLFGSDRRRFRLHGLQDQPRMVFQVTGFGHMLQTSPS